MQAFGSGGLAPSDLTLVLGTVFDMMFLIALGSILIRETAAYNFKTDHLKRSMTYHVVWDAPTRFALCADLDRVPTTIRMYGLEINSTFLKGSIISLFALTVPVFARALFAQ